MNISDVIPEIERDHLHGMPSPEREWIKTPASYGHPVLFGATCLSIAKSVVRAAFLSLAYFALTALAVRYGIYGEAQVVPVEIHESIVSNFEPNKPVVEKR